MGQGHKFHLSNLHKLKDPERLKTQDPELLWHLFADLAVGTVVDIGAGLGFFAIPFSRQVAQGKVYACDISEEMLDYLREAINAEGVVNVEPVHMEEVAVPLPDGVGDVLFMANLHHELDHPELSMGESLRLLRPGGRIAIMDWKPEETPKGPPLHVRVAPATVRSQLAAAGFTAVCDHDLLPYHYVITADKPA